MGNVCDGFETYKVGGGFGDWKNNGTSGMLSVDSTHVFAGLQSAHFHVDAGANKRLQLERTGAPIFPAQNNTFWGRVMVWASNLPMMSDTENKNVHYDVIQASGATPGEYRVAGMGGVLLNYEPHDCYYGTSKMIPQDRWACWEWLTTARRMSSSSISTTRFKLASKAKDKAASMAPARYGRPRNSTSFASAG